MKKSAVISRFREGFQFQMSPTLSNVSEMSEHFNVEKRLAGKMPSGHFCASFGLLGHGKKDLATIKSLAYDGWFIRCYAFELERCDGEPYGNDHVKEAIPLIWDSEALAR